MTVERSRLLDLIPALRGRRVMVIGDLVADRYLLTEPLRLSREAPVMITRFLSEEMIPGGAANALNNLLALGATVFPAGVIGDDDAGRRLVAQFSSAGVDIGGIVVSDGYRTITKTRVMVGDPGRMKQQVLRIDHEPTAPPDPVACRNLEMEIRVRLESVDAVLLSDYGYGVVTGPVLDAVRGAAGDRIITADSRYHLTAFRGVTLATPNQGEAEAASGVTIRTLDDLERAGRTLLDRMESPAILITRGNRGMSLFERGRERLDLPATGTDQVVDVSGAGDTVIAVATLALAAGASLPQAAALSNLAGGVVVTRLGAATCSPADLLAAAERHT